jgi:cobalt/nickel transport system permease protein
VTGSHPRGQAPGDGLYRPGDSAVHALPAHVKIVAAFGFVFCVVATPRTAVWAFAAYALLLGAVAAVARIPPAFVARRAVIELPFVVLAVFLPFAGEPDTVVLGVAVSQTGLWAAFALLVKGTLGVVTSVLLAATTPVADLLVGLQRLRLPEAVTQIATLMVRYLAVVSDEARRMRMARLARGDDPRFLWQLRGFARSLGTLFLRSYERGERVYLAMVSRGYEGRLPLGDAQPAGRTAWLQALALPVGGLAVAVLAWSG